MEYPSLGVDKPYSVSTGSWVGDKVAMALATLAGVGYLPIVPATWGSLVTCLLYFIFQQVDERFAVSVYFFQTTPASRDLSFRITMAILIVCLFSIGTWAASRATKITGESDPRTVVIDEVVGQLVTFLFVPAMIGWVFIVVGFLAFRFFDIWKPFPARQLERLPSGLGVMADDVMAGIYSAGFLWFVYSVSVNVK